MTFKEFVENWDYVDAPEADIPHEALPAFPGGPPPVAAGMIRLYRGTDIGKLPHSHSFWTDESGLEGVAKPFAKTPGRHLVYVDVPEGIAKKCLLTGCVTDGEYQNIPEKYKRQIRIF